jgi:glycosyltransferase involved in cell wall biosynthesis
VCYVPGVGIDLNKFSDFTVDIDQKRIQLGIPKDALLLLSVGELNENKNHETVIKALSLMEDKNIYYIIAGEGNREQLLLDIIKEKGLSDRVKLLGFRTDIDELCAISDIYVFPSFREGLSVSLMEAMASGLACAVSAIRGNTDLIDENGGVLFDPSSVDGCRQALVEICSSDVSQKGEYNTEKIKAFSLEKVIADMRHIYFDVAENAQEKKDTARI